MLALANCLLQTEMITAAVMTPSARSTSSSIVVAAVANAPLSRFRQQIRQYLKAADWILNHVDRRQRITWRLLKGIALQMRIPARGWDSAVLEDILPPL